MSFAGKMIFILIRGLDYEAGLTNPGYRCYLASLSLTSSVRLRGHRELVMV